MHKQHNEENALWTKKYAPKNVLEVIGHDDEVKKIVDFVKHYNKQKKKAIILYGPAGSGKTSLAVAISKEFNFELIEVNASDDRNKDALDLKVKNAIEQHSLFSYGSKLILIDEIDGLSGTFDRGATTEIAKIIANSKFPVIMTANDPWDKKFSELRKISELIELGAVSANDVTKILEHISKKEEIHAEKDDLKSLARRSGGDARGAINDLQTISAGHKKVSKNDIDALSDRRQIESVPQALTKIFKTTDVNVAITAFDDTNIEQDEQFLWIEENIPIEYEKPIDIYRAFDALSRADVFRGRIIRQQHWHFMTTINSLLTCGVALAKEEKYKKFVAYKRNERILKIWILNNTNAKKKSICEKIALKIHESKKSIFTNSILYYKIMCKNNSNFAKNLALEFGLEDEEVEWLCK